MIPSASEAGQQPTLTSLPGQESNWRGQKQPWYDNKERNAFQACTPFVLRNYISTQTQVPLLLVSTHTHALIDRPAVGPKMGLNFSVLSKFGVPGLSAATTKQVYERHFANKDTKEFEQFHIAYVEFCKYFNTVMPGQDFDTPSTTEIQKFFDDVWKPEKNVEKRKELFFEFMRKNVREAKVDDSFFIAAGLAVPVAAVLGKRASGHIPYVKSVRLDLVPNVVFVPFVTLLGIMGATAWQMGNKSAAAKVDEDANEEKKTSKHAVEQQQKKEQNKAA